MRFLSQLKNKNLKEKICLLRVDFNVEDAKDALRLQAVLPTIRFLLKYGARVVILSHRGRPRGFDKSLSLKFVIPFLEKNLKQKVAFVSNLHQKLPQNKLILLENLRFYNGEEANNLAFAKKLARFGDFYVNDAFGVCHRENASVTQLPKLLPAYAGLLLEKEIKTLSAVMKSPKKPLVLIFGGAKVHDKLHVIKKLLPKTSAVLLGSSIIQGNKLPPSAKIKKPIDWINDESGLAMDIGPLTVENYAEYIQSAKTIIWNGPLGLFEDKRFAAGSIAVAKAIAKSKAFSVVGGGETTQLFMRAISNYQFLISKKQIFLSTGGGAMLEFLSGKKLPGISALF